MSFHLIQPDPLQLAVDMHPQRQTIQVLVATSFVSIRTQTYRLFLLHQMSRYRDPLLQVWEGSSVLPPFAQQRARRLLQPDLLAQVKTACATSFKSKALLAFMLNLVK
jgi:hypothetical protein